MTECPSAEPRGDVGASSPVEPRLAAYSASAELTVVVPTFNEADNVGAVVERLEAALLGIDWEVVFVDDDSPDMTGEAVCRLGQSNRRVRRIVRIDRRGLASACIEGMLSSTAPYVAVMDGDLQHDENVLRVMLGNVRDGGADIAVGTRYGAAGSLGAWGGNRRTMSRYATRLCKIAMGVELSDPLSGFFLMRRSAFNSVVRELSGLGFKILLDIVSSARGRLNIVEAPYTFRERQAGESKLDTLVLWEFMMLLLDKKFGKFVPVRFITFAIIGAFGVAVHFCALALTFQFLHVDFVWSQSAATVLAMVSNYTLNNVITYRDRRKQGWAWFTGLARFMAACSLGAVANVGVAQYVYVAPTNWALAAMAGVLVGAVWNYAMTSVYTWRR